MVASDRFNTERKISFIPIIDFETVRLGISTAGWWVRYWTQESEIFAVEYKEGIDTLWLTPILEFQPEDFLTELGGALKSNHQSTELLERFPLEAIVTMGLKSHAEEVVEDALRWVSKVDTEAVRQQVAILASNKQNLLLSYKAKLILGERGALFQ